MYAMSWEINNKDYKYEGIQHGYSVIDDYEEENESDELSLNELLNDGFDIPMEEIEMEME